MPITINGTSGISGVDGSASSPAIQGTDTNTGISFPAADTVAVNTGGSERVRCDSSGRVGIGTSPSTLLHLASADPVIRLQDTDTNGYGQITVDNGGSVYIQADEANTQASSSIRLNVDGTERARIDSSGRLLVGTSSAQGNSTVTIEQTAANSAPLALRYTSTNDNQIGIDFYRSRSSSAKVENTDPIMRLDAYGYDGSAYRKGASIEAIVDAATSAGDMPCRLVFSTTADGASSPTERMRITSGSANGALFLFNCTSTPSSSVKGSAITTNGSAGNVYVSGCNTTSNCAHVEFANPNGYIGSINTSGSATAYNTSSDYRLKENVEPVSDGITRLQQLKPSRFNFIADPDKTVDGFLAHEAAEVVPECVTGEKDAVDEDGNPVYQGIDQSKLVPLLTAALQEAIGRIETLEAEVAALKAA